MLGLGRRLRSRVITHMEPAVQARFAMARLPFPGIRIHALNLRHAQTVENGIDRRRLGLQRAGGELLRQVFIHLNDHLTRNQGRFLALQRDRCSRLLFNILRQLDDEGMETVYSEVIPPVGIGLAVMNRLGRAAAFRTIEA